MPEKNNLKGAMLVSVVDTDMDLDMVVFVVFSLRQKAAVCPSLTSLFNLQWLAGVKCAVTRCE